MSGAGHVQDMNNRIRQNRSLRPSKRPKFKENNREGIYTDHNPQGQGMRFKTVSEEELITIKNRIFQKARSERRWNRAVFTILWILGLLLTLLVIWLN